MAVIRERVLHELQRQTRWWPLGMLVSTACTFAALLVSGPNSRFGGPLLYVVVLCGSGALLVLSIVLLVLRDRIGIGSR
ncbi:hypothetical protein [Micromonospora coriariae]|uniref:hypothetical protein n=1 Tax=Micromonospora coriariae TaxID=285665 RepID=UPI000B5B0A06|nr:hypothetical protein [Micromonospora coriariae]